MADEINGAGKSPFDSGVIRSQRIADLTSRVESEKTALTGSPTDKIIGGTTQSGGAYDGSL